MENYIGYLFATIGVIALVGIRRLDNRCIECNNTDTTSWIIGGFIAITALGPKNSKLIAERIADKISSFSFSTKND